MKKDKWWGASLMVAGFGIGALLFGLLCEFTHPECPSEAQEEPIEVSEGLSTTLELISRRFDAIEAGFCGDEGGCPGQIADATEPCRPEDVIFSRLAPGLWEFSSVCGSDGRWILAFD